MILYHGSNVEIEEILLSKGRHGKDFGRGFYLSADYMQAVRMSENVVRREGNGTPFVTKFEFDETSLDGFSVKRFEGTRKIGRNSFWPTVRTGRTSRCTRMI